MGAAPVRRALRRNCGRDVGARVARSPAEALALQPYTLEAWTNPSEPPGGRPYTTSSNAFRTGRQCRRSYNSDERLWRASAFCVGHVHVFERRPSLSVRGMTEAEALQELAEALRDRAGRRRLTTDRPDSWGGPRSRTESRVEHAHLPVLACRVPVRRGRPPRSRGAAPVLGGLLRDRARHRRRLGAPGDRARAAEPGGGGRRADVMAGAAHPCADRSADALAGADPLDALVLAVRRERRPGEPLPVALRQVWLRERGRLDWATLAALRRVGEAAADTQAGAYACPSVRGDSFTFLGFLAIAGGGWRRRTPDRPPPPSDPTPCQPGLTSLPRCASAAQEQPGFHVFASERALRAARTPPEQHRGSERL